jgi:hypothetical protein
MTIPDFETLTVQRLQINAQEIAGMGRVYELGASLPAEIGELPVANISFGPLKQPIPLGSEGAGQVIVVRDYAIELAVTPVGTAFDVGNIGSSALSIVLPWFAIVRDYFMSHPRLQTDGINVAALGALRYLHGDLSFADSGMITITPAGGAALLGIKFTLTIAHRGIVSQTS